MVAPARPCATAADDLLDARRVRQHGEHDPAGTGHAPHVGGGLGADRLERLHAIVPNVVHAQMKPVAAQVRRHRTAHVAESDEADRVSRT
jgi:hypothetical protein